MPDYETVPLAFSEIGVAAAQMNPGPVDHKNPSVGKKDNLEHLLELCDQAYGMASAWPRGRLNLIAFPEFSITGYDFTWRTKDFLDVALDLDGPEVEAIAAKAKELDIYVAFASHIKEKDWPGHYFNCSMLVGPTGLLHRHWKAHGRGPGREFATTVHDVLDEYVERYGADAMWPVSRTPIGNIATYVCAEGFQPETARAFTFKGAEILCRCIGGGGHLNKGGKYVLQFRADCAASDVYGIYSNGGSGPTRGGAANRPINGFGGSSMVVDYFGRVLNVAHDSREAIVFEKVPIANLRENREKPSLRTELFAKAYEFTPGKYPANLYSKYGVPENANAAIALANKHARY
jgi:predicted amidohydrolase